MKVLLGGFVATVLMGGFLAALVVAANNHPRLSEPPQITLFDR